MKPIADSRRQDEERFLQELQVRAKAQARIESSSPLPEFVRPLLAIVGVRYWIVLFVVSAVVAVIVSVLTYARVYTMVTGL